MSTNFKTSRPQVSLCCSDSGLLHSGTYIGIQYLQVLLTGTHKSRVYYRGRNLCSSGPPINSLLVHWLLNAVASCSLWINGVFLGMLFISSSFLSVFNASSYPLFFSILLGDFSFPSLFRRSQRGSPLIEQNFHR